jgi:hypothetical protein
MQKVVRRTIKLFGQELTYDLRLNHRLRNLRLTVRPDTSILVSQPTWLSQKFLEKFINSQAQWIKNKISYFKNQTTKITHPLNTLSRQDYLREREAVRRLVLERLQYFNNFYQFSFKKISIRNQSTRWGSCSQHGTLNFNFRLGRLPLELCDYIIVHELCHLKELNHSVRFWNLVAQQVPDYKACRKKLKRQQF